MVIGYLLFAGAGTAAGIASLLLWRAASILTVYTNRFVEIDIEGPPIGSRLKGVLGEVGKLHLVLVSKASPHADEILSEYRLLTKELVSARTAAGQGDSSEHQIIGMVHDGSALDIDISPSRYGLIPGSVTPLVSGMIEGDDVELIISDLQINSFPVYLRIENGVLTRKELINLRRASLPQYFEAGI